MIDCAQGALAEFIRTLGLLPEATMPDPTVPAACADRGPGTTGDNHACTIRGAGTQRAQRVVNNDNLLAITSCPHRFFEKLEILGPVSSCQAERADADLSWSNLSFSQRRLHRALDLGDRRGGRSRTIDIATPGAPCSQDPPILSRHKCKRFGIATVNTEYKFHCLGGLCGW